MRFVPLLLLTTALAACSGVESRVDKFLLDQEIAQGRTRPGLEPLANRQAPSPVMVAPPPVPEAIPEWASAFPEGRLDPAQAALLLAGDPAAQRFLAVKRLAIDGLIPLEEAEARRDANLGVLLPLSHGELPPVGLDRPVPGLDEVLNRYRQLWKGKPSAEAGFLLDGILPRAPAARMAMAPPDVVSARQAQARLERLKDAGLITRSERDAEKDALERLIAGGTLPEKLEPPPPPPAPKKPIKKTGGSGTGRTQRLPGGVHGGLEVIPSPAGAEATPLAADAKGPAGIHLLSMGSAAHGEKAWEALKKEHSELSGLSYKVVRADLGDLGVTYRLVAGPMDAAGARKMCEALKPKGQTCTPTAFPQ